MSASSVRPVRGTCYGYEIRSELPFRYLRSGSGDPLDVVAAPPPDRAPGELLREWRPPAFPTHVRLHADGEGHRLWIDGSGWYVVDPDTPRITVPPEGDRVRREERVWGLPVLLCFLARGDLPLHAASVELEGRALLLGAPSGFGKTTLAAGFAAAGHRVLAEDLTCLRPGSPPSVVPGPAMLRVRRDVADGLELDGATELGRDDERVHLALGGRRGGSDPVPLAGISLLKAADTDPHVERATGAEVVRDLWALSFNLPTDRDRARCFRAVGELASTTETWNVRRRLELEDLRPTVDRLVEAASSSR